MNQGADELLENAPPARSAADMALWELDDKWREDRRARGLPVTHKEIKALYGGFGFNPPSSTLERRLRDVRLIYFLQCDDLLKVGVTTDIAQRMRSFRLSAPRGLRLRGTREAPALLAFQVEKQTHAVLKPYAKGREWFKIDAATARAVAEPIIERAWRCIDSLAENELGGIFE